MAPPSFGHRVVYGARSRLHKRADSGISLVKMVLHKPPTIFCVVPQFVQFMQPLESSKRLAVATTHNSHLCHALERYKEHPPLNPRIVGSWETTTATAFLGSMAAAGEALP